MLVGVTEYMGDNVEDKSSFVSLSHVSGCTAYKQVSSLHLNSGSPRWPRGQRAVGLQ
jgi:hypothetical protein